MQQFFVEDINKIEFTKDQKHQINRVLRMQAHEPFRVVDTHGNGFICEFEDNDLTAIKKIESIQFHLKSYRLKVIMSLIRNDRLEWMIQKAAETGVDEIVLYQADHGVVRDYGNKTERKLERFNKIAFEASEQSYRQFPLKVTKIITKKELQQEMSDINLVADVLKGEHLVESIQPNQEIVIIIGPEGGFSEDERILFKDLDIHRVSLGPSILRAETAPIVAASFVSLLDKEFVDA